MNIRPFQGLDWMGLLGKTGGCWKKKKELSFVLFKEKRLKRTEDSSNSSDAK